MSKLKKLLPRIEDQTLREEISREIERLGISTVQNCEELVFTLDQISDFVEHRYEEVRIDQEVALAFAFRCDLFSDALEKRKLDEAH